MAVVDSYFSDFHCVSVSGTCTDSQAISGGAGDLPMGPFKIVNNFLEAAGENIIFGGAAATATPADIEIRHNHFFKPLIWMPGQPGFIGGVSGHAFIVKNLFEIKNAQRVLFEGNLLENSWGGVGQTGFAIVLTPRNQTPNICPLCRVTDVTLRYSKIRHVATDISIAKHSPEAVALPLPGSATAFMTLFSMILSEFLQRLRRFAMIISNAPPLHDVKIDHVTAFPPRVSLNIGSDRDKPRPTNFAITNSILSAGKLEVTSTGGGQKNCTFGAVEGGPEGVFKSCFSSLTFAHNAIIGPSQAWPCGNSFPKNEGAVGFVNYNNGMDGDYRLCKNKPAPLLQTLRPTFTGVPTGRTWVPISTRSKPRLAEPNKIDAIFRIGYGSRNIRTIALEVRLAFDLQDAVGVDGLGEMRQRQTSKVIASGSGGNSGTSLDSGGLRNNNRVYPDTAVVRL